jgi:hypothetical protein
MFDFLRQKDSSSHEHSSELDPAPSRSDLLGNSYEEQKEQLLAPRERRGEPSGPR